MNGQDLRQLVINNGHEPVVQLLQEGLELSLTDPKNPQAIFPRMMSLKECAIAFCGEEWYQRCNPPNVARATNARYLQEAGEAIDVSAFSHITGQIIYTRIMEGWNLPPFIMDNFYETVQTDLDGERVPWISPVLGLGDEIHPGMPYPEVGLVEEFIDLPALHTYGHILSIHKLAVFYDRTGRLLTMAGKLGERLRWKREFLMSDTFLGVPGSAQFTWKGVAYNPYQVNGTYWSNDIYSNPLVDWTSFRRVEIQATKILEPDLRDNNINQPIDIDLDAVVVMPAREMDLSRTLHATELRSMRLDTAPNQVTIGGPVLKSYKPHIGKQLWRRAVDGLGLSSQIGTGSDSTIAQADDLWFLVDTKNKPLQWSQAWPLLSVPAPPNNPAEFERDICHRQKSGFRGTAGWIDPRRIFRIRGTAA